jgi:hypothetical protein
MPAPPNNSLVGLLDAEPPPGRGEAEAMEPLAEGPTDARAVAFLPSTPGEGEGLGLAEGGRRVAIE